MPTDEGNIYPKGVVLPGLVNVDFSENETSIYEDNNVYLLKNIEGKKIDISLKPEPKMSRKRFKKLLMSKGVSRNAAEQRCNLVAANHGTYAWFGVCCTLRSLSGMPKKFYQLV